jgi:hypothetical protein
MQHISRILLALTVLLSGVALVPFVDVPAETFEWQRYAGVYEEPELVVNYPNGLPGSFFHFSGTGFSPSSTVTVSANGNILGSTTTDDAGNLEFNIGSTGASLGSYYITVMEGNVSLTERIILWSDAPLRPQEGGGDLFNLSAGIGITELYMPVIVR